MKASLLLGLAVLAGDQPTLQPPQDVKEVSVVVSGLRTDSPAPELAEAVRLLRLAASCSANHVTWVRGGRAIFRLEEDYLFRKAERLWRLFDVNSGWTLVLRERMQGFEFDSLAMASSGEVVQRFIRFQEEGRHVHSEILIEAGGAGPFSVTLTEESLLPGLLKAVSASGHKVAWRNSAPPYLARELRLWHSLECESNNGECPESYFYELATALLDPESLDQGSAHSWEQVDTERHRGFAAGIARLDYQPFQASECSGSEEASSPEAESPPDDKSP